MTGRAIVINPANTLVDYSLKKFFISLSALAELREWQVEEGVRPFLKALFKGELEEKTFFAKVSELTELLGGQRVKEREVKKAFLTIVGSPREEMVADLREVEGELFTAIAASTAPSLWEAMKKALPPVDLTLLSFNIHFTAEEDLFYAFIFNTLSYHSISKAIYVDSNPSHVERAQQNGLNAFLYVKGKRLKDYIAIAENL